VIRVAAPAAAGTSAPQAESFKSDWPDGKSGYTVELGVLDKGSASAGDVDAAKKDAEGKGATDVGALDSDDYASLPGGKYVVYSGVYGTKAKAEAAAKRLEKDFPDARVVKVSNDSVGSADAGSPTKGNVDSSQLNNLNNLSGDAYVKRSKKLPDDTAVGGTPPPKDNKAPGGGSGEIDIK
jgi:hypothetical protein